LGFGGHWRLLTAVAELANRGGVPWWLPAVALLALGLGAAGVLRVLVVLLAEGDEEETAVSDPLWLQITVGIVLLLFLWLAIFPQTSPGIALLGL
jgi:formate hydrogenlyase subunit 3/multisubunit Na+/H+ antiporter MnhD subunit